MTLIALALGFGWFTVGVAWAEKRHRSGRKQLPSSTLPSTPPLLAPYREQYYGPPQESSELQRLRAEFDATLDMLKNPECYGRGRCYSSIRTIALDKLGVKDVENGLVPYQGLWPAILESSTRKAGYDFVEEVRHGTVCRYFKKKAPWTESTGPR